MVTVSSSGLTTAISNGSATITATVGTVSATVAITVSQQVVRVLISPDALQLNERGQTAQLTADPQDANGITVASASVTWAHEDGAIASVDASGLVTAEGNGTALVTATAGGVQAAIPVQVSFDAILPEVFSITPVGNEYDVWVYEDVVVTFTEDIDPSGSDHIVVTGPSGQVPGTISFSGPVLTFTPAQAYTGFSEITITATTNVQDLAGNALATNVSVTVWTGPNEDQWYTLSNEFLGPGEHLAVSAGACVMQAATSGSTEYFRFVPISGDRYWIRTEATGNSRQLEAADGVGPCLFQGSGNFGGMEWFMVPNFDGTFLLHAGTFGTTKALDGTPSPTMVDVGLFTGQMWTLTERGPVEYTQLPKASFVNITDAPNSQVQLLNDGFGTITDIGALPIVTANYEPNQVVNDEPIGVWHDGFDWYVFNERGVSAPMPLNSAHNVVRPSTMGVSSFVHAATGANLSGGNYTWIDHPSTDGNANAIIFVATVWRGVYVPAPIGVWYDGSRWTVFTEDVSIWPDLTYVHVMVANENSNAHVLTSDGSGEVVIDHPQANGDPDAVITVTQRLGSYNNANIAVYYDGANWVIFNQDGTSISSGAQFNVLIGDGFPADGLN